MNLEHKQENVPRMSSKLAFQIFLNFKIKLIEITVKIQKIQ